MEIKRVVLAGENENFIPENHGTVDMKNRKKGKSKQVEESHDEAPTPSISMIYVAAVCFL